MKSEEGPSDSNSPASGRKEIYFSQLSVHAKFLRTIKGC